MEFAELVETVKSQTQDHEDRLLEVALTELQQMNKARRVNFGDLEE